VHRPGQQAKPAVKEGARTAAGRKDDPSDNAGDSKKILIILLS
jgi:hypothetical protein